MLKMVLAAALVVAPAVVGAQQLGNSMGQQESAQPKSASGSYYSGASQTPTARNTGSGMHRGSTMRHRPMHSGSMSNGATSSNGMAPSNTMSPH